MKFIKTAHLISLAHCMCNYSLQDFNGDMKDNLKVFHLTRNFKQNQKTVKISDENIMMIVTFITNNQSNLLNNLVSILDVLAEFLTVLYRQTSSTGFYFRMDMGYNTVNKIKAIKALRSMREGLPNDPYIRDFGSLHWSKYAVESECMFGPVSKKFIEDTAEFSEFRKIFTKPSGKMYKDFANKYNSTFNY